MVLLWLGLTGNIPVNIFAVMSRSRHEATISRVLNSKMGKAGGCLCCLVL